jgi:hypothetical protein
MNDQERAEEHLKTIRRLMERATIYRAISAPSALVGGLFSVVVSILLFAGSHSYLPYTERESQPIFIALWLLVLALTAATNSLFIIIGAKKRNEPVISASMKAALMALAPALILGATITFLLPPVDDFEVLVGIVWATCYGLGLLATGSFAPRSLIWLGLAFFISGVAGMICLRFFSVLSTLSPLVLASLFMAATFGLFHLIYALCVWPRDASAPEDGSTPEL